MMIGRHEVPYQRQINGWSCGAAALAMVYQSLGLACDQEEIWDRIAGVGPHQRPCSRAQALAADASSHGLCALMIEARDPWLVLERSLRSSVRIIVNHCPSVLLGIGHYSVLVGLDDESVTLHDPADMPGRTIPR